MLARPWVSHLSLASPPLTGGTCPRVPLRISRLLFKSISMLNSRRRGRGVGDAAVAGTPWGLEEREVQRGWKGEVEASQRTTTLSHLPSLQADPQHRRCPLTTFLPSHRFPLLLLLPLLLPCLPLYSPPAPQFGLSSLSILPFGFSHVIPIPVLLSLLFFFLLSLSHSVADFHSQGRVLISDSSRKRVVTRCCA